MITKQADSTFHYVGIENEKGEVIKADFEEQTDITKLKLSSYKYHNLLTHTATFILRYLD
jgi:hypothetical protein